MARQIAIIKRIFPKIEVGDIEPVGAPFLPDWTDEIRQWMAAYRNAVGEPLRFFHADVNWNGPWRQHLKTLVPMLRAEHIPFGVIYIGNPGDASGEEWAQHAEEKFVDVEASPEFVPDQAIFQSWLPQPERNLPNTTWNDNLPS